MNCTDAYSPRCLRSSLLALAVAVLVIPVALAHDYSPGPIQNHPVLLRNGNLYTISDGVLEKTDLLFENGRISAIGRELEAPENARVIDITGQQVYPGLIAPISSLGLVEIGAVRATLDIRERGLDNGELTAYRAYNPDSEIIPTVRANGVTTALIVPGGQLIMGRSSLMNLDGWTVEDALEKPVVGLHLDWPRASIISAWWMEESIEEQKEAQKKERARLRTVFDEARAYYVAKQADLNIPLDSRWEGFLPLFDGTMPLFVHADDYRQIDQAVAFVREYGFRMILVGGREAWKVASLLLENDIPVVFGPTLRLPMREDDDYDLGYKIPVLLHNAGVKFCLSTGGGASGVRNLPLQAGQAVAFGLPRDIALRAITLTTAEILGVDGDLGSLEVGKKATLVVSEGDLLDPLQARVRMEFIEGRPVDLSSKHTELYEKYRAR